MDERLRGCSLFRRVVQIKMNSRQIAAQKALLDIEKIYGPGHAKIVDGFLVFKKPDLFKAPEKVEIKSEKGACKKCGKKIGRGVGLHERKCK